MKASVKAGDREEPWVDDVARLRRSPDASVIRIALPLDSVDEEVLIADAGPAGIDAPRNGASGKATMISPPATRTADAVSNGLPATTGSS